MSKLAQAGESSTASPGAAICAARATAFPIDATRSTGAALAPIAFSINAASRPMSNTCLARSRIAGTSGAKSCPLPASQDQHRFFRQSLERRHGGAYIGALGIVQPFDAAAQRDPLHAVR